jgi:hypothetical protein
MSKTLTYNSVQFGTANEVVADDISSHVHPANSASDSRSAGRNIRVNSSDLATYQQHTGAEQGPSSTRVQLLQDDGLVRIGKYEVKPEVAERLKTAAPSLFEDPSVKAMEAAKAADNAKDEEALRDSLNRHADDNLESYHQHLVGEASTQNLISLLVYGQNGEAPSEALLQSIAREMGEPVDSAVTKINAVAGGVQRQFSNLATAMGLDATKAADWLRDHRKDTSMVALQSHFMRRSVMSWKPLLDEYQAATGDGRKRG